MRRLERQRKVHAVVMVATVAAFALGIGWSLPRSEVLGGLVVAAAVLSLMVVWLRSEPRAPSHGLRSVVRLPATTALAVKAAALRSRVEGTTNAVWARFWNPVPQDAEDATNDASGDEHATVGTSPGVLT